MSTRYIIRNGGFQKKEAIKQKPKSITRGTEVVYNGYLCSTLTRGKRYKVRDHFCYWNTYGEKGSRFGMWDQFIILKNNDGWTVKVNLNNFEVIPNDVMEVLYQTI